MPWPDRCAWFDFETPADDPLIGDDGEPAEKQFTAVWLPVCDGGVHGPDGCYCDEYEVRQEVTINRLRGECEQLRDKVERLREERRQQSRKLRALQRQLREEQGRRVSDLERWLQESRAKRLDLAQQCCQQEDQIQALREAFQHLEQDYPEVAAQVVRKVVSVPSKN